MINIDVRIHSRKNTLCLMDSLHPWFLYGLVSVGTIQPCSHAIITAQFFFLIPPGTSLLMSLHHSYDQAVNMMYISLVQRKRDVNCFHPCFKLLHMLYIGARYGIWNKCEYMI